jgi:hypothetical protein
MEAEHGTTRQPDGESPGGPVREDRSEGGSGWRAMLIALAVVLLFALVIQYLQ